MYQPDFLAQVREQLQVQEDPAKLRQPGFETSSGIPLKNSYTPADIAAQDPLRDMGAPGKFPFTRHVQATGYRGKLWTMRQYAGFATAEESNARYRYLLANGTTGLSVAFDLPTQIGLDPDHPMSFGEVGKVGVSIASLDDMRTLFKDIPLDQVTTSMTINAPASVLLALYLAVAEEQGVSWDKVGGTIQNDILKEYMARGTYIFRRGPRSASSRTSSPSARIRCPPGTPSPSPATTSAKRAARRPRRSRSRWLTASPMCRPRCTRA